MSLNNKIAAFWVELTTSPDSYKSQPYEGMLNQLGHVSLGHYIAAIVACSWFVAFGEMPVRLYAGLALCAGYLAFEVIAQKWQGKDTLQDWYFFSIGVGAVYVLFEEIDFDWPYTYLKINVFGLLLVFGLIAASLVVYALPRIKRKYAL